MKKRQQGYSLFEFTGVLAILLPIIVGAIDINNALHAYTALQESTNIGLRCLYTTDQGCINPDTFRGSTRQYDWYINRTSERGLVRQFNYSGEGFWLSRPRYVFDTYRVDTVASVNYSLPRTNYSVNTITREQRQTLQTILEASQMPYVTGTNPRYPQFYRRRNPNGSYSGNYPGATVTLPSNRIITRNSAAVTIPLSLSAQALSEAAPGTACFKRHAVHDEPDFSAPCTASGVNGQTVSLYNQAARVVLWIRASARGDGSGKVKLRIENTGNLMNQSQSTLGGQVFGGSESNGWTDRNFYPRGLDADHINIAGLGEHEEWGHSYIVLPLTGTVPQLVVEREVGPGSPSWSDNLEFRIDAVHVYRSIYEVRNTDAICSINGCDYASGSRTCALATQSGQQIPSSIPIYEAEPNTALPGIKAIGPRTQTEVRSGTENLGSLYSAAHFNAEFSSRHQNERLCNYEVATEQAAPQAVQQSCPDNFGAISDPQRRAVCPITHAAITSLGAVPQEIHYQDTTLSVPRNNIERESGNWDFVWQPNDCSQSMNFAPPPSLARYRVIRTPSENEANMQRTSWHDFGLGSIDPRTAKSSNPAFQCSTIRLNSMRFDGHGNHPTPANLPGNSLFSNPQAELVRDDMNCYHRPLHQEALRYGLPGLAFFEPQGTYLHEVSGTPMNTCTVGRTESVIDAREIIARRVNEGTVPEACKDGGCSSVVSNVVPGSDVGATFNLSGAMYRAQQELSHAYPRALPKGCSAGDENCPVFSADTADAGQVMRWTSAMKVPMNLLGGTPVTISYTGRRTQERRFAE